MEATTTQAVTVKRIVDGFDFGTTATFDTEAEAKTWIEGRPDRGRAGGVTTEYQIV